MALSERLFLFNSLEKKRIERIYPKPLKYFIAFFVFTLKSTNFVNCFLCVNEKSNHYNPQYAAFSANVGILSKESKLS